MTRRQKRCTSGPPSRCKKIRKSAQRQRKKAPQAQKSAQRQPALRCTEAWSSGETLVARSKASEAKRSALPEVGGADATLRERNKRDTSEAKCHARLSEAGLCVCGIFRTEARRVGVMEATG